MSIPESGLPLSYKGENREFALYPGADDEPVNIMVRHIEQVIQHFNATHPHKQIDHVHLDIRLSQFQMTLQRDIGLNDDAKGDEPV